jgi:2-haloacid dehalogenase
MRRREFVLGPLALYGAATLRGDAMTAGNSRMTAGNRLGVKALAFDVFGTVVDWRGSIVREGEEWGRAKGLQVDWGKFADRWRDGYMPMMDKVRKGTLPWMKLDALHRMILDELLVEFQIEGLSEDEKEHLNHVWHRLKPWPDAVRGLERMKKNYVLAALSNGNVSLLVEMAKNAGLPWDAVLSAELFHHFKPDREVYLGAVDLLGCKPAEVMMVAAHPGDLRAAQDCGLRTAFVARPLENGPGNEATASEESKTQVHNSTANLGQPVDFPADVSARDFLELAEKLG